MMRNLAQDLKFALRQLTRSPMMNAMAIATLALGIGLTTVMFSVLYGVLLRPLPFPRPNELVSVLETFPQGEGSASYPNFLDWKKSSHSFAGMAVYTGTAQALRDRTNTERVSVLESSASFFEVLRTSALLGHTFAPSDDAPGAPPVIILSATVWKQQFQSDPEILGKTVFLGGQARTVVGVLSPRFHFSEYFNDYSYGVFVPLEMTADLLKARSSHAYSVIARLNPGVRVEQAQSELAVIARQLELQYPEDQAKRGTMVIPIMGQMHEFFGPKLLALTLAVFLVLLIACINVGGLQMARSAARKTEVAVRQALGAGRFRLIRQILTETVLLAVLGGMAGLALTYGGLHALQSLPYLELLRIDQVGINAPVFVIALMIVLLSGLCFGLPSALQLSKMAPVGVLQEGRGVTGTDRRGAQFRSVMVVVQVSLAFVLLVSLGLLLQALLGLTTQNPGFSPEHVITMEITVPNKGVLSAATTTSIWDPLLSKVRSLPGVESAGLISRLPLQSAGNNDTFNIVGRPKLDAAHAPFAETRTVGGDFYTALHMNLVRGRLFNQQDYTANGLSVIINDVLAQRYFPGQDPMGQRIAISDTESAPIIGVVEATKQFGLAMAAQPEIDYSLSHVPSYEGDTQMSLVVRTVGKNVISASSVVAAAYSINRDLAVAHIESMEDVVSMSLGFQKLTLILIGIFGVSAVLLALIGLYALLSYTVVQRTRELGVRFALGAQRSQIVWLVIGKALKLLVLGIVFGGTLSLLASRLIRVLLFGVVSPFDAAVWAGIPGLILVMGLLAAFVPAWRAASLNPLKALRD